MHNDDTEESYRETEYDSREDYVLQEEAGENAGLRADLLLLNLRITQCGRIIKANTNTQSNCI